MSALLSPINLLTLWNYGGLCPPSLFLRKGKNMKNIKENMELIFLITVFITSLSAITPIS